MEQQHSTCLFITYVEKEGPFLKVWGQTDKNTSLYVEQVLHSSAPQFDNGLCIPRPESLQIGVLCCAKYKDSKYYRARITSLNYLHNRYVEVNFVDYGNKDIVPVSNIRSLEGFDSSFISIAPQATSFLLAEAVCPRGEWNESVLEEISKEVRYTEVTLTVLTQATRHYLVKLFVGTNDLAIALISRGFMRHTSLSTQEAVLLSMMPRVQPGQPVVQQNIATYKAFTLEPGSQYPVYVSYVTDGPCNFSVQLKQSEEVLGKLMKDINSMTLVPLEGIPIPGTVCLARCIEDGHICRAVVTNEVDGQFKVFYVDFGNFEVVPLESLYEIPFKCVIPKVMAIRFALAGVEKSTVTLEMQCAFKQFVDNRLIHMKVMPNTTKTALPRCELWDPETSVSALDIVNQAAAVAYPEHISLNRGFNQPVKISYVFSCNRFYAQLKSKEDDLQKLMLDIQQICRDADAVAVEHIKVGLPCYARYQGDHQWYRSQVVEASGDEVKVHYVDYGNEESISPALLKPIEGKQLTVLRPQAIECCLNGYQNMEPDPERDRLLEELILEQEFTMKVVEMQGGKALVELIDKTNYNVASLLLDKIAATRSQVSPMLVQAGNKIEHRKHTSPKEQHGRPEHPRIDREQKREDLPNENASWRQENRGYRNKNEIESDEINQNNMWRQGHKAFSKSYDKNRRENDLNDSGGSETSKSSNRPFSRSYDKNRNDFNSRNRDEPWKPNNRSSNNRDRERFNGRGSNRINDWGSSDGGDRKSFSPKDGDGGGFRRSRDRFANESGGGGGGGGWRPEAIKPAGYRRTDYRREGSELSSSGSEKSSHKSFKNNARGKTPFNKKPDRPYKSPSFGKPESAAWEAAEVPDAAPGTAQFAPLQVDKAEANIIISWFHNPAHFYCQLEDTQDEFKRMMEDVQRAYKDRRPSGAPVGAPIIGLFPEDGVLYRARVLEELGGQFKVHYVDFGNVSTVDKVWPIETRFMTLPAQAIRCSLHGIEPTSETWLSASEYAPYFDKKQFRCSFISKEDDKVSVKLDCDSEDVAEKLLNDGLARSAVAAPSKPVEIALMVGQQFRAMLMSVNSLADFAICLQCGALLTCSVYNLAAAAETWESNLKERLTQILIVYVDNVVDDRLEVTLYDADGAKIKLIDDDGGAFETVELLCPYLILYSQVSGFVSYVEGPSVFLQPADCADSIDYLLNQMYECYENSAAPETSIVPGEGFIYAAKSSDSNWYRARVVSLDKDKEEVVVNYIDYGNSESVKVAALRELSLEFLEMSAMCIAVTVNAPTEDLLNKSVMADLKFTETSLEATILEQQDSEVPEEPPAVLADAAPLSEDVAPLSEDVAPLPEDVAPLPEDVPLPEEAAPLPEDIPLPEDAASLPEDARSLGIEVVLSHIDSPSDFYVQLADSMDSVQQLQATLQEQVAEMPDLENPTIGVLCAAPYSVDQQWYRAQVLDADSDITTVRFVDFGSTDVLDNSTTRVKTLPPHLLALEVYATRCRLKIKPDDEEWSAAASQRFEQLTGVEPLTAQFVHQDEKTNYVELYSNGDSVRKILIDENLASPDDDAPESKSIGFVSHLNSPSEFWIQLENCIDELEWIAEQLAGAESFPELEDLAPGTLCAALFPDDEMWYRARILSNTVAGLEVLFVDYGNSCTSCSLRELPEDLVMLPPLAQKCSLQKPAGLTNWSPEMVRKFTEISAEGQTMFAVRKLSTGETALVELLLDGEDVATALLPQTEEVFVKSFETLSDLVLAKDGEELPQRYQLEPLPDVTWNDESVSKFAAISDEGKTSFQAEFVSDDTVRLYVGLNDVRLDLSGTKKSSATSSPIKMRGEPKDAGEASPIKRQDDVGDVAPLAVRDVVEDAEEASPTKEQNVIGDVAPLSTKEVAEDVEEVPATKEQDDIGDVAPSAVKDVVEDAEETKKGEDVEVDDSPAAPVAEETDHESAANVSDVDVSSASDPEKSPANSPNKSQDLKSDKEEASPLADDGSAQTPVLPSVDGSAHATLTNEKGADSAQ